MWVLSCPLIAYDEPTPKQVINPKTKSNPKTSNPECSGVRGSTARPWAPGLLCTDKMSHFLSLSSWLTLNTLYYLSLVVITLRYAFTGWNIVQWKLIFNEFLMSIWWVIVSNLLTLTHSVWVSLNCPTKCGSSDNCLRYLQDVLFPFWPALYRSACYYWAKT